MKSLTTYITEELSNHYIPVGNLIVFLQNIAGITSTVIEAYEDYGILISSSRFNTVNGVREFLMLPLGAPNHILDTTMYYNIQSYIESCGLAWYISKVSSSETKLLALPEDTAVSVPPGFEKYYM